MHGLKMTYGRALWPGMKEKRGFNLPTSSMLNNTAGENIGTGVIDISKEERALLPVGHGFARPVAAI